MNKFLYYSLVNFIVAIMLWFSMDFITTSFYSTRGFSKFFITNEFSGHINKPNFKGYFGGPLDDFYSEVNIGNFGERKSFDDCENPNRTVLFLGDSSVAGFEVKDNETFISIVNKNCNNSGLIGYNFGVRAHDTHSVIGNYSRIQKKIDHNIVYYLITPNDITENMNEFHYANVVKKFGRVFNGDFISYNMNFFEKLYFNTRIFVSDKFYLTTKLISFFENYNTNSNYVYKELAKDKALDNRMLKLKALILKFNKLVVKNKAKLIVAIYPCPGTPQCNSREYEILLKELLAKEEIIFHELTKEINSLESDNFLMEKMRFPSDPHLSNLGHSVVGKKIEDFILNIEL